ncbi:SERINE-THREONINE PROTEIN KINASE [Salix koriyanagi]|uniref:SERINE-THREONINE PROTEIN KINASE n=1 Tax=Salix koriyanagi TaxID=2511006 RepID=A0A9Q0X1Y5_9ROSI|nr:SERINE-THREONINE PROTEIN KINASE [Salix koriyanagi]
MGSSNGFYSGEFNLDAKWLVDPKLLFVGPKIGEGAHAKVYEGKYKNQNVAIKIVHGGETPEEIAKRQDRFAREVAMLSRVQHKNLVKFIGACKEPVMVIVTELLLGGTLRKYFAEHATKMLGNACGSWVCSRYCSCYGMPALSWDHSSRPKSRETITCPKDIHISYIHFEDLNEFLSLESSFAQFVAKNAPSSLHSDKQPENLILTADHKTVKLADFGLAREESLTEMMTAETGTYRWMAPELYSTVTLRHGEKKHYNHKCPFEIICEIACLNAAELDCITSCHIEFARVLDHKSDGGGFDRIAGEPDTDGDGLKSFLTWLPSVIVGCYPYNVRPSAEDLPEDLALIVTSCWKEDPNARPNFNQIIQMLLHYLSTISAQEPVIPARIFTSENAVLPPESPGTSSLMAVRDGSGETPITQIEDKPRGFFFCFNQCY